MKDTKIYRRKFYKLETGVVFKLADIKAITKKDDTFIVIVNSLDWIAISQSDYDSITNLICGEMEELEKTLDRLE